MKNILLINEGDSQNIGDQAINCGVLNLLKNENVTNISLQKGKVFNANSTLLHETISDADIPKFSIMYHLLWTIRYLVRLCINFKYYMNADTIIIGGGGVIMDNRLQFPTAIYLNVLIANLLKKKINILGVSSNGPMSNTSELLIKWAFNRSNYVYVRDLITLEHLNNMKCKCNGIIYDFAFNIDFYEDKDKDKDGFDIGINLSSSVKDIDSYKSSIFNFIKIHEEKKLCLITTGDPGDEKLLDEMISYHPIPSNVMGVKAKNPNEYMKYSSKCKILIATRLHGAILSLTGGTKTYIFDNGPKFRGFFNSVGLDGCIINISEPLIDLDCGYSFDYNIFLEKQREIIHAII